VLDLQYGVPVDSPGEHADYIQPASLADLAREDHVGPFVKRETDHVGEAADGRRNAADLRQFSCSHTLKLCGKGLLSHRLSRNSHESPSFVTKVTDLGRGGTKISSTGRTWRPVMSGRHSSGSEGQSRTLSACDADRCLYCGRRPPETLSREELAASARSWRRVEVAAAGLRLTTDRRQGRLSPQWVHDLAAEKAGTPLPAGWDHDELLRLAEDAREKCSCSCHGTPTDREVLETAREQLEELRAAAHLRATLDRRLGRSE